MLKSFFKSIIIRNRDLIQRESRDMREFMVLLMKHRNTSVTWTTDEIKELKAHLIHLSYYVPVLLIFSLPGGMLLLPLLAEAMERRGNIRRQ